VKKNGGWSWILDFFYACMRMKILCLNGGRGSVWWTICCLLCGGGLCVSKVVMAMMSGGVL